MLDSSFIHEVTSMRKSMPESNHPSRVLAASLAWLAGGSTLLFSTAVPAHTAMLGWTPAFWLLAAPLLVLLATLHGRRDRYRPARTLSRRGVHRRRAVVAAIWN
jgi:hypothetical protein